MPHIGRGETVRVTSDRAASGASPDVDRSQSPNVVGRLRGNSDDRVKDSPQTGDAQRGQLETESERNSSSLGE